MDADCPVACIVVAAHPTHSAPTVLVRHHNLPIVLLRQFLFLMSHSVVAQSGGIFTLSSSAIRGVCTRKMQTESKVSEQIKRLLGRNPSVCKRRGHDDMSNCVELMLELTARLPQFSPRLKFMIFPFLLIRVLLQFLWALLTVARLPYLGTHAAQASFALQKV
jgi:hypothetical protein